MYSYELEPTILMIQIYVVCTNTCGTQCAATVFIFLGYLEEYNFFGKAI
jgi:hypothetical protein